MTVRTPAWTEAENVILKQKVHELGTKNWSIVANFLPGRLGRQCRDHWFSVLDPEIKRTEWTADEDLFIVASFLQQGPKWVKIANLP